MGKNRGMLLNIQWGNNKGKQEDLIYSLSVMWPLGGQGGQSATPDSKKNCQKSGKKGKNQEKLGKKRKNREEKAKIGKVLSLCPSWQIGLAMLL